MASARCPRHGGNSWSQTLWSSTVQPSGGRSSLVGISIYNDLRGSLMKSLNTKEGKDWLLLNSWNMVAEDSWQQRYDSKVSYHLPGDTGKKTVLARALASLLIGTQESALWITDWGAFQSCQNVELFYGYRRSFGENRLLIDAPFHVFSESD